MQMLPFSMLVGIGEKLQSVWGRSLLLLDKFISGTGLYRGGTMWQLYFFWVRKPRTQGRVIQI